MSEARFPPIGVFRCDRCGAVGETHLCPRKAPKRSSDDALKRERDHMLGSLKAAELIISGIRPALSGDAGKIADAWLVGARDLIASAKGGP